MALLIGFAVGLGVAEAAIRLLEKRNLARRTPMIVSDPVLGSRIVQNAPGHDAKGFRNTEVPTRVDIVVVGDSQTWGINVQAPDAWPQQLGRLSGLSVYNMAVGGYGPDQYLLLTDQALELSPRTIIVGLYLGNDLYDAYSSTYRLDSFADMRLSQPGNELTQNTILARSQAYWDEEKNFHYNYGRTSLSGWSVWLREHSAIGRLLNQNGWWPGASDIDYEIDKSWATAYPDHGLVCDDPNIRTVFTSAYRLTGLDLEDPRVAEGLRITKLVLARIQHKVEDRANLVILMIPTKELVYAKLMQDKGLFDGTYARDVEMERKARADLQSWCRDNEIRCIDALPDMQSAIARRQQIYPSTTESHPNAAGYTVVARAVNEALGSALR